MTQILMFSFIYHADKKKKKEYSKEKKSMLWFSRILVTDLNCFLYISHVYLMLLNLWTCMVSL